ncbi:hypothetical protein DEA98_23765 [Brucella pseudogrignonensis]|nr:hypothetical protein [Brucella pseudogrignonensis]
MVCHSGLMNNADPASRAYTIRALDIDAGWLEIDFYLHEIEGLACKWAKGAKIGDTVGLMGPVGRPLRRASRYLMGADATGLPAIGRMLEEFSSDVTGRVIIAVDSEKTFSLCSTQRAFPSIGLSMRIKSVQAKR